jgi:hypothetical protein
LADGLVSWLPSLQLDYQPPVLAFAERKYVDFACICRILSTKDVVVGKELDA